jgi:hypothetical protein
MQTVYERPAGKKQHHQPILKSIRAKCLDCSAGQPAEVRACPVSTCALHPYRMGENPFSKPRGSPFPTRDPPQNFSPQTADVSDGNEPSQGRRRVAR